MLDAATERLYDRGVDPFDPPARGEQGYRDWCIRLSEMGLCSCEGCGGHLVDEFCISCGCRHWIREPKSKMSEREACWTPNYVDQARCGDAVRSATEAARENARILHRLEAHTPGRSLDAALRAAIAEVLRRPQPPSQGR
jgi:hypothetical protein